MMNLKPLPDRPPMWNGYMQSVHKGPHPGKAAVVYLPFINLPASDETCINSTLHYVAEQSRKCDVVPILTFDQPLYWKARKLIANAPVGSMISSFVLRLGGFHTLMSFLGAIGHLMEGSGLQEIMQLIYAPDTVHHLLSGKAYSRASRAHMIISSALHMILFQEILGSNDDDVGLSIREKEELCNLFDSITDTSVIRDLFDDSVAFNKFTKLIKGRILI